MKNLTAGTRTENSPNNSKRMYPKSGQNDGSMTRNSSGVSKVTTDPKADFAEGGGSSTHPTYPKKGQAGTPGAFTESVAAPTKNNAKKLS